MDSSTSLLEHGIGKKLKSMQIFSLAATVLLSLIITIICVGTLMRYEVETDVAKIDNVYYWNDELPPEQHVWFEQAVDELENALNLNLQKGTANNVVILLVHGISAAALAAARFARGQHEAEVLSWDRFPHVGRLKNSCSSADVCDLYTMATALLGGVKTNFRVGGYDAAVEYRSCNATFNEYHRVESIFEAAQNVGMRTGLVTTRRLTGSVAAALYAHTPDTAWECDASKPAGVAATDCLDVAQQLLTSKLNVMLGGGRQTLVSNVATSGWDPIDETVCNSADGRNLLRDWQKQKLLQGQRFTVLQNEQELLKLNGSSFDYVLGVFANSDLQDRQPKVPLQDTTTIFGNMLSKAFSVLERAKTDYMLLAECGVKEESSIEEQIGELLKLDEYLKHNPKLNSTAVDDDTLVLLVFPRGKYIKYATDSSAETELLWNLHEIDEDDAALDNRFYNVLTDTLIFAKGPQSFLFHGVHEEVFMAHVVSYALQIGPYRKPAK